MLFKTRKSILSGQIEATKSELDYAKQQNELKRMRGELFRTKHARLISTGHTLGALGSKGLSLGSKAIGGYMFGGGSARKHKHKARRKHRTHRHRRTVTTYY
jgi:hypothetical protein